MTPLRQPLWPLIAQVLNKVLTKRVSIMMVVPYWSKAPWDTMWQQRCVRSVLFTNPVFLDARLNTRIGILDGTRLEGVADSPTTNA